jgi:hypothetical protein
MPAAVTLIEDDSLRTTPDGFEVKVRLNWYRSLPLSCIERVSLVLDGQAIDPASISFAVNDHAYPLNDMPSLTGEYWYIQDSAVLQVRQPSLVAAGEPHTIEAEITLRAPYIMVGPGKFLTMPTRYTTVQVAA